MLEISFLDKHIVPMN